MKDILNILVLIILVCIIGYGVITMNCLSYVIFYHNGFNYISIPIMIISLIVDVYVMYVLFDLKNNTMFQKLLFEIKFAIYCIMHPIIPLHIFKMTITNKIKDIYIFIFKIRIRYLEYKIRKIKGEDDESNS